LELRQLADEMECNMRSLNSKLALSALGVLTLFASPACAQELHRHHHRHALLQSEPVGPSARATYMFTPNVSPNPDDPTEAGGGSVGYNEMLRQQW
jgi:hypothetical protein